MIKYLEKEEDFNNLIQNRVLVDFYADWCGPCKRLGTILEEINDIDILKVNVDLFQNISNKYGVMSIPTIIIFDKGNEIKKSIGFKTKNELLEFIKQLKIKTFDRKNVFYYVIICYIGGSIMIKGKPFVKWAGGKRQVIDKL